MLSITINVTWRTIMGALLVGVAVAMSSLTIGRAEHVTPDKSTGVYNCSTGTACLTGNSSGSNTWGIYAESTGGSDALHAVTSTTAGNSAIAGISRGSSGNGRGIYGSSSNGYGVYGTSSAASGVYGTSSAYGIGVEGATSGGSPAVYGVGASEGVLAVGARNPLDSYGSTPSSGEFYTDEFGDGVFSGNVTANGFDTDVRKGGGVLVRASVSLAPHATIEDSGTAGLTNGVGVVHLERDFASTIDTSKGYQVFLTPDGDTRGLYVAAKYEGGFVVRETEHGRSSIYFDYRVLAHPVGSSDDRFPIDNSKRPPRLKLPAQPPHMPSGG